MLIILGSNIDEYWVDDVNPTQWRLYKQIGIQIQLIPVS